MSIADKIGFGPTRVVKIHDSGAVVEVTPHAMLQMPMQSVALTAAQYERYVAWVTGAMMMQDALPDLSPAQREILMTGIGPDDFYREED